MPGLEFHPMLVRTLSLTLALVGCTGEAPPTDTGEADADTDTDTDSDADSDTDSDTDTGTSEPSITLTAPGDGATLYTTVPLAWTVSGFTIDPEALANGDTTAVDGVGHVHVKLDGTYMNATAEDGYTLTGVAAGTHTITAVLAGNDHAELAWSDSVTVNVLAPSVSITAPTDGATLEAASAELAISVSDFAITPDVGGAATIGQGHFHVSLNGEYLGFGTDATRYVVPDLPVGEHTLAVELVHADHTPLDPPVSTSVTVTVPSTARGVRIDDTMFGAHDSASVWVPVSVANFGLAPDDVGGEAVDGEGHYHVYLDGVYQDYGAGSGVWLYDVAGGEHTVEVRLASSDHAEIAGTDLTTLTVAADRPAITITSPAPGEVVSPDGFFVMVGLENFSLSPDGMGGANVPDEGHWHLYLDGYYYSFSAESSTLVTPMDPGTYELQVELVNNDHSSLDTRVLSAPVTVTIP